MKYSELISFNPIEDVIQLTTADNADKAREYVKTYVMSDAMAESLQAPVIDQLQMDEVITLSQLKQKLYDELGTRTLSPAEGAV